MKLLLINAGVRLEKRRKVDVKKRKWRIVFWILGGAAAVFLVVILPAGIFCYFDRKSDYTNDTAVLCRPDVIEIKYNGKTCTLEPGADEYEEIYEKTKWCWENFTLDRNSGLPLKIMLAFMDEKPEDTMEVTFRYGGTIEWDRGMTALLANTYTFFPMADEDIAARMYISKDGNYLEEAIVVVFKPTEDLAAMLREAAEGR